MAATPEVPRSLLGSEAYEQMHERKAEAQARIDEAAKFGANLSEALRHAARPLKAALLAKRVYEAELVRERELAEKEADEKGSETLTTRLWGDE